jgi:riboflavin kinase / FMN adenylyltransferase
MSFRLLTIGNFDGVHLGHQALIKKLVDQKKKTPAEAVALSFEPHPVEILKPGVFVDRLTPASLKVAALKSYGIDTVDLLDFSLTLAAMSPQDFFDQIILQRLGRNSRVQRIVIGDSFRFGKKQAGTPEVLQKLSQAKGIEVEVVSPVLVDGKVVSSSRIREALSNGDVLTAKKLLNRPYRLQGSVVHGEGRGRRLGISTANLAPAPEGTRIAMPKNGVYVTQVRIGNDPQDYRGVSNIGFRPTFGKSDSLSIETHLLDFHEDLYGKTLTVDFLDRIRDEKRFPDLAALVEQIQSDIAFSRSYQS